MRVVFDLQHFYLLLPIFLDLDLRSLRKDITLYFLWTV